MTSKKPSLPVPGAADDTDMAVDRESHDSGVSQDPSTAETSALPPEPHALQSPPSPRAGTPANTDTDPSTDPHADTLATDINTDVTVDVGLPSAVPRDLPPAMRTARSRPPEHAPGPAGRASSAWPPPRACAAPLARGGVAPRRAVCASVALSICSWAEARDGRRRGRRRRRLSTLRSLLAVRLGEEEAATHLELELG